MRLFRFVKARSRVVLITLVSVLLIAGAFDFGRLALAPTRQASIDAVQVRNSLVSDLGSARDAAWSPRTIPSDYKLEAAPAPAVFQEIVAGLLAQAPEGLTAVETAIRLARHLRVNARDGDPIQANTYETYRRLTSGDGGYCSDFTQSFNALALAAGLEVREWGFTWETLANGHAFSEVWEPRLEKWVLIDSHHAFFVVDDDSGAPLSALEFRARVLDRTKTASITLVAIDGAQLDAERRAREISFYRRGMPRMFLLMGNSIFTYDAHPVIRRAESLPRAVEQLIAIVVGQFPRQLFVPPQSHPEVREQVQGLIWLRNWTFIKLAGLLSLAALLFVLVRPRRAAYLPRAKPG